MRGNELAERGSNRPKSLPLILPHQVSGIRYDFIFQSLLCIDKNVNVSEQVKDLAAL